MRSPDQLYGREPGDETLARCRSDKWPNGQTPWDGPRPSEETVKVRQRHTMARTFCQSCVLLDACETALSDMEKADIHVEGVMAGRYTDVRGHGQTARQHEFRQADCRFCGIVIKPQADATWWKKSAARRAGKFGLHAGEGLCEGCFPKASRKARGKSRESEERPHEPRHPFRTGWEAIA